MENIVEAIKKRYEFSDALFFVLIPIAVGIVLCIAPYGISALSVVVLILCGTAIILIARFYSGYARLTVRSLSRTGWFELIDVVVILILFMEGCNYLIFRGIFHAFNLYALPRIPNQFVVAVSKLGVAFVIAAVFSYIRERSFRDAGMTRQNMGKAALLGLILMLILLVIMMTAGGPLVELLKYRFPEVTPSNSLPIILICLIDPGIVEEFVFRCLIQSKLERCMDYRLAILVSAAFFSLWHVGHH